VLARTRARVKEALNNLKGFGKMPAPARVGACATPTKFTTLSKTRHISIRCTVAKAPAMGRAGAGIFSKCPDVDCSEFC